MMPRWYILHTVTSPPGRMNPRFHVVCIKFWPYHLNIATEMQSQRQDNVFSVFCDSVLINLCELYPQRCSCAYFGFKRWLFELLLPSFQLKPVSIFTQLTGYFFFRPFILKSKDGYVGKSQQISSTQTSSSDTNNNIQSHVNHFSSQCWGSVWTSLGHLNHIYTYRPWCIWMLNVTIPLMYKYPVA